MHKILIADGDDALSERIAEALREARYQVFISNSADDLFAQIESVMPVRSKAGDPMSVGRGPEPGPER